MGSMPMIGTTVAVHSLPGARTPGGPETTATEFGFDDLVDIVNPLQHLPIVGSLYRAISDDGISPVARVAGGALFGGVAGFFGAIASEVYEAIAGESVEETVVSLFAPETPGAPARGQQAYLTQQALSNDEIERRALGALPRVSMTL